MLKDIYAGETIDFSETIAEYPASPTCWLSYILLNNSNKITLTSTADGTKHHFFVPSTASYAPGKYTYQKLLYKDGSVILLGQGEITITPLYSTVDAGQYDARSFAEKMVEAIKAVLENRATMVQSSITYKNRTLQNTPFPELIEALGIFTRIVEQEKNMQKLKNGKQIPKIGFGF